MSDVIIPIFCTLLGVGIGAWLSNKQAIALLKRQRFLDACAEFKNAFVETIYLLNASSKQGVGVDDEILVYDIIKNRAVEHEKAMIRFRYHVTNRDAFDRAWEEYQGKRDTEATEYFLAYMERPGQIEDTALRQLAIDRIERLWDFANV